MSTAIHINWTKPGHYRGYVRALGGKRYRRVTGRCATPEKALALAVSRMEQSDKRALVLFCENEPGYYEPHVVMEANRK